MFSLQYLFLFFSFIITFFSIQILIKNAYKLNLLDHPGYRKLHKDSTPLVGGLGIVISFIIITICSICLNIAIIDISFFELCILILSSVIIILTGLIDDFRGISASNKFLFQIMASTILVLAFKDFQLIQWPFSDYMDSNLYNSVLSVFYLVSILNAINLIDGLDGLAGGVSIIITISFIIFSLLSGLIISDLYILFILLGSLFAFIIFNKPPAKTFLGDLGSLFIGWIFGIVSLMYAQKTSFSLSILIPIMALGLPSFDVIFVMLKRFNDRHGYNLKDRFKAIFNPDNNHLHHLIVLSGISKKKATVLLYVLAVMTNVIALYSYTKHVNLIYGIIAVLLLIFIVRYIFLWKINKRGSS
tara:strand:+ start:13579 stop:14655 length:1077 start_codon:yes stop_codon:yes gene_type:complete